jgi:hypothetical protein
MGASDGGYDSKDGTGYIEAAADGSRRDREGAFMFARFADRHASACSAARTATIAHE